MSPHRPSPSLHSKASLRLSCITCWLLSREAERKHAAAGWKHAQLSELQSLRLKKLFLRLQVSSI